MLSTIHPINPTFAELALPLARAAARGSVPVEEAYVEFRRRIAAATGDDVEIFIPERDWFDMEVHRHLPAQRGNGQ